MSICNSLKTIVRKHWAGCTGQIDMTFARDRARSVRKTAQRKGTHETVLRMRNARLKHDESFMISVQPFIWQPVSSANDDYGNMLQETDHTILYCDNGEVIHYMRTPENVAIITVKIGSPIYW